MSQGSERSRSMNQHRVVLSSLPAGTDRDKLESVLSAFQNFHILDVREDGTANINFEAKDEAEKAVTSLNDKELDGTSIQARLSERRSPRRILGGPSNGNIPHQQLTVDFPLRILVHSEMVGAIIGRGGQTIRQITQQTRARVDVHRKENVGSIEKAITIYGQPENCTNACFQILKVMQEEAQNTGKNEEILLKILAHNNLIGRIIGKQGATIKRIMEDTDTKITVSPINEINSYNMERVITIRGGLEQMSKAEAEISAKLKTAYESDVQAMAPHNIMFPGLPPTAMMSTVGMNVGFTPSVNGPARLNPSMPNTGLYNYQHAGSFNGAPSGQVPLSSSGGKGGPGQYAVNSMFNPIQAANMSQETTYVYIPNAAVGAIIGTKGSHIRNIIKFSGASVKIAQTVEESAGSDNAPSSPSQLGKDERKITIFGSPESQWKAQYLIFQKLNEEGFASGLDIRLTVEIMAPTSQVGRIIGKGGANVRELQRVTNAMIKLPEQGTSTGEETPVHIIGTFYSVQSAQRRLRAMIQTALMTVQVNGNGPSRVGLVPPQPVEASI